MGITINKMKARNNKMKTNDSQIQELYNHFFTEVALEIRENEDPFAVAAVLMSIALRLYKTSLDEPDFNKMVASIVAKKGDVLPFFDTDKVLH
jgi:hypothetical protein